MSEVDRLFGEYLGTASAAKQAEISQASQVKQAQFAGGYRAGAQASVGLTPELTEDDLLEYGNQSPDEIVSRDIGRESYLDDATADRGYGQAAGDNSIDVLNGILQGALGITALGAGVVDADAGAAVSGAADRAGDWLTGHQSDALNDRRRAHAERNSVTGEHNALLAEQERASGSSDFMAGLRQIGRDVIDGAANLDGMAIQSGSAQGIGSLLLGGVIGKGIGLAGEAAAARLAVGKAGPSVAAFRINQATQMGKMPVAIGALEGGGAYTQAVNEVMALDHAQLLEGSPDYAYLIREGWDPADAKAEVANHAGLTAAAIQAPIGAATGTLVSRFESAPLAASSLKNRAGNILRETVEEGIQSGSGQLATNVGINQNADQDRSLTEGVGQAAAEGAIYGAGTAGALQAPGIPVDTAKAALVPVVAAGKKAGDLLEQRRLRKEAELAAEAPNSLVNTAAPAAEAMAVISEPGVIDELKQRVAESVEDPAKATVQVEKIDRLVQTMAFDATAESAKESNPAVKAVIEASTDKFDLLRRLSSTVTDPSIAPVDRIHIGVYLRKLTQGGMADTAGRLIDALGSVEEDDPSFAALKSLEGIVDNFANSPEVAAALEQSDEFLKHLTKDRIEKDTSGRWAKVAAEAAVQSPEKVDPEVVDTVLAQESNGNLPLTPEERQALLAVQAMHKARQTEQEATKKLGLRASEDVSFDILDGDDDSPFKSAASHQKLISLAVHAGNARAARERLEDMRKFAVHLNNKVAAANENLAKGDGSKDNATTFQALSRETRTFGPTGRIWVNPIAPKTVRFVQRAAEDARAVVTLFNELAGIYESLGVKPLELVELDQSLQDDADQVRYNYRKARGLIGAKKAEAVQEPAPAPQKQEEQSAPLAQEREPVKTAEAAPVRDKTTLRRERFAKVKKKLSDAAKADPGKVKSMETYPAELQTSELDQGLHHFAYVSSDGKASVTGKYSLAPDGSILDFDIGARSNPSELGISVRGLIKQIMEKHGATLLHGYRLSEGRDKWFQIKEGKVVFSTTDPREAEAGREVASEASNDTATEADADAVQNTNEPDQPAVDEKSETVGTESKIESEEPVETVDKVEDNSTPLDDPLSVKSIEQLYPQLVNTDQHPNQFLQTFRVPDQPKSRLLGLGTKVLRTVYDAFVSVTGLREFVGDSSRFTGNIPAEVLKNYQDYLRQSVPIMQAMEAHLLKVLGTNSKMLPALMGQVEGDVLGWVNGRALNLVEIDATKGTIKYNQELLQSATMATLQWLLIANGSARQLDREDIAKKLGLDIGDIPPGAESFFNHGYNSVAAKRQLAQMIRRFWGLSEAKGALLGNAEGIPEALAAEFLTALADPSVNLLKQDKPFRIEIGNDNQDDADEQQGFEASTKTVPGDDGKLSVRTYHRFLPVRDTDAGKLIEKLRQSKANLLEQTVMVEPEDTWFIGTPPGKAPSFQMKSRLVRLTRQQKQVIERYQKTPFKANMRMVELYESLTKEQFLELFGAADPGANAATNVNHAKSLDGQRVTADSSYETFMEVLGQIRQHATEQNIDPAQVEVFYEFGVSKVGRLHMLGRNNPQASKIIREIMLPTHSTVDLAGNEEHRTMFFAAIAQHLDFKDADGRKVHQMPLDQVEALVHSQVEARLPKSLALLRDRGPGPLTKAELAVLKDELGERKDWNPDYRGAVAPGMLHALQDYARFTQTEDPSAFDTALYLEADGVTDGPVNAMMHLATGPFSGTWVSTMAKGGLFLGSGERSLQQHFATDPDDIYTAVKDQLLQKIGALRIQLAAAGRQDLFEASLALENLMGQILADMSFDDSGNLVIKRGITKNPVTVTIYGSGPNGIAGKITGEIMAELYERMSESRGQQQIAEIGALITTLTSLRLEWPEFTKRLTPNLKVVNRGQRRPASKEGDDNPNNFKNYTFTRTQEKNLRSIVHHLFVTPMVEAMDEVIGETRRPAEEIRDAIQIQSIFLEHAFQVYLSEILKTKKVKRDFITRAELQSIYDRLKHLSPYVQTGTQNFFIAGSDKVSVKDPEQLAKQVVKGLVQSWSPEYGRGLDDAHRSDAYIEAPVKAGVKTQPTIVIGTGDGQMMQNFLAKLANKLGLAVFDGFNFSIADAKQGSRQINQAVFEAWKMNPIADISDGFAKFLADIDLTELDNWQLSRDLTRVLFPKLWYENRAASPAELTDAMEMLREHLAATALWNQARKNVLARTDLSVDHMASAEAPHVNTGQIKIAALTPDEQAAELNKHLLVEVDRLRKQGAGNQKVGRLDENISKELSGLGEENDETGAKTATMVEVRKFARGLRIPKDHAALLDAALKQLVDTGYQLVHGTLEAINAQREAEGLKPLVPSPDTEGQGWTDAANQTIYLVNPTSETLVHEILHGATYDRVHAYYNDPDSLTQEQRDAVARIEAMMHEWIPEAVAMEQSVTDRRLSQAARDALRAINKHLETNPAAALNEFMAWNLSNRALVEKNRTLTTLARIASDVLQAIKELIWGKARNLAPGVGKDLFSNLRFNTEVLMNNRPSVEQHMDEVLEHATGTHGVGHSERLRSVRDGFGRKITALVHAQKTGTAKLRMTRKIEDTYLVKALDVVKIFQGNGWPMSGLERQAFRNVVLALMTEAELNPNALARMHQHYAAVMKELTPAHFLVDPATATINEKAFAKEKLDTLKGVNGTAMDEQNRSTLMSAFLALALTSDEFRAILSKLPVVKQDRSDETGINQTLENHAIDIIDAASKRMAGERQNSASVQAAIDALGDAMMAGNAEDASSVEQFSDRVGEGVGAINDIMVGGVQKGSRWAYDQLTQLENQPPNAAVGKLAKYLKTLVSMFDDKLAGAEAEGITSLLNQAGMPIALRELWTEISGRLDSNANVYDMIKVVRTYVQQTRQQFRDHRPKQIAKQFSRALEEHEWAAMTTGLAKTDFVTLFQRLPMNRLLNLLVRPAAVRTEIRKLEEQLDAANPGMWPLWQTKARQLAHYMNTGEPGQYLLRNAYAVTHLIGHLTKLQKRQLGTPSQATIDMIDQLVTLYALESTDPAVLETLKTLATDEPDGMTYVVSMLIGQRKDELAKVTSDMAIRNHFKGYVPTDNKAGTSLIVANDKDFVKLSKRGYVRVGDYKGSVGEKTRAKRGYYFTPVSGRAMYMQGIMQNVRTTAYGIDPRTGYANGPATGGVITNPGMVNRALVGGPSDGEPLMPIYDASDAIVGYERSLDPAIAAKLEPQLNMAKVIGIWQGRQAEEKSAYDFNADLVRELVDQWRKEPATRKDEYVNLYSKEALKDPVLADSVSLLTPEVRELIRQEFGNDQFWVKRSMINDALGYRSPSVSDLWTGITRWSPEVQKLAQDITFSIYGKDAFRALVKLEQGYQTFIADARVTIVVKSVVVPMANIMSNVYHLASRGVPLKNIYRGFTRKAIEVDLFVKNRLRRQELQGDLRVAQSVGDTRAIHTIEAELRGILDANRRLSIWPLIAAGEFASISDAGISNEEIELVEGRLSAYVEKLTDKLSPELKTAAKYGIVARDTALFKGLQRAVEYGDFLAKAVLYEDLVKRQGKSHEYARGRITEEFVNYDRQPGRWRSGLENNGVMWFWNFKLRAAKIALATLRNNPFHLFLASLVPTPDMFGLDVGTPFTDNFVAVTAAGDAGWSLGLDQGLRAHLMNPYLNIVGV